MGALEVAGVAVEILPPLPAFPDSIFVEDTALTFTGAAIVLRPGAASRIGETREIAPVLERRFARVLYLDRGFVDGGDVLTTSQKIFIGRSARTTQEGAEALMRLLAEIGRESVLVSTPKDVLHFKSDCALLDDETILATARLAATGLFARYRIIVVPNGEEPAANALRVNERILVSDAYPRTAELIANAGFQVTPLPVREVAKIDAGLSCMSLRWRAG
jgi:dimethylargininase